MDGFKLFFCNLHIFDVIVCWIVGENRILHSLGARFHNLASGRFAAEGLATDLAARAHLSTEGFLALAAGGVLLTGGEEVLVTLLLQEEGMDMGEHTAASDSGLDQSVELIISLNGKLQMTGGDTGHLHVLGGVTGQLEDLGGEVLKNSGSVDRGISANASGGGAAGLQQTVNTADGEMKTGTSGTGERLFLLLAASNFTTLTTFSALAGGSTDFAALTSLGGGELTSERLFASRFFCAVIVRHFLVID